MARPGDFDDFRLRQQSGAGANDRRGEEGVALAHDAENWKVELCELGGSDLVRQEPGHDGSQVGFSEVSQHLGACGIPLCQGWIERRMPPQSRIRCQRGTTSFDLPE